MTRLKSRELIKLGEAVHVYKLNADGKIVNEPAMVWASQMPRVQRVGLTSSTHIERAVGGKRQDQLDIRTALEITKSSIEDLIAPPKDDPWVGRPRFTSFTEERTPGCFNDPVWRPDPAPRKSPPPVLISSGEHCPGCQKDKLEISIYQDGATRQSCRCGYLQVFSKKVQPGFIVTPKPVVIGLGRASQNVPDLATVNGVTI